jgi:acyl-CoA oxidase
LYSRDTIGVYLLKCLFFSPVNTCTIILQLRPNVVALVDAFNYTDHYLSSVLGRYDGNVYPALYEQAWKDPLNESVVPDGYEEYIRPVLKQQLRLSRL